MSNVYQLQTEEQVYDTASLWVARLDRELSQQETAQLRAWLSESTRHREIFLEMAALWDRMDRLSVLSELFDPPTNEVQPSHSKGRTVWAAAASILALALAFNLLAPMLPNTQESTASQKQVNSETSNTLYETGIGVHSSVNLPDGTKLLLNTDTKVAVTYSDQERLLVLHKGELHVEVAHDKQRPLRVDTGSRIVEAVGTAFNVLLRDKKNFDVIVTDGRVRVKPSAKPDSLRGDPSKLVLEPVRELTKGQKLSVRDSRIAQVETIDNSAIKDKLSWRDGNLVFRGETLREALQELSRYTPTEFEVMDAAILDMRIAGLYKAGDVEGLLNALHENFKINHHKTESNIIELSLQGDGKASDSNDG
ncbi:FecR domain-containing protein [Gilvimarinus agarilyticus]|uniref:FecR family protein n=1 Tax=Gilvimarinus sp. 2_MG-2023 TaxID=3062666 RepID=UPI001C09D088|nr:FecR domain-containing protein [Gilvimarinus sp. 2_MG-2023]MBU2884285.1 FecR domain-containing protein [Gilvimarinus agarilyticus]MDO6569423.1 FecR domain-containing protein [Gilvimarinus sp. 2_MG-2023]